MGEVQRGLITSSYSFASTDNGISLSSALTLDDMKYFSLYWDHIVVPANRLIYIGLPQEEIFKSVGILYRPTTNLQSFSTDKGPELSLKELDATLNFMKSQKKDTSWAMHHFGIEPFIHPDHRIKKDILKFELFNALPTPSANTNLIDILEFKYRRHDELNRLHISLNSLYEKIATSDDIDAMRLDMRIELKASIDDLNKSFKERFGEGLKRNLKLEFDVSSTSIMEAVKNVPAGLFCDSMTGMTIPLGTLVAVTSPFVKVGWSGSFGNKEQNSKALNLNYLTSAKKYSITEYKKNS
ncbi:DUF6236 family protein [Acinetobacter haemolyticus]|uniref:DUF6236 family protein n=1 Tax=Acinetobacter haemolyticus TaxID=29430 RepID=UPI0013724605|nr:DUF6236 family protein [Acinetobacter haemolyticus]NAR52105.1 hypothetical protein [Acinetobacter haemolyticus]